MRYWVLAGILLLAFLVQSVLGPFLAIRGISPNIVLVVIVAYGLLFGWQVGLAGGVVGGLLLDLTASTYVGIHVLALGTVGLLVGLAEERVFKDNVLLAAVGGLVGSLISQTVVMIVLWVFGRQFSLLGSLRDTFLPAAFYDMLLCTLIYHRIYKYYRYLRPDPRGTIVLRRH